MAGALRYLVSGSSWVFKPFYKERGHSISYLYGLHLFTHYDSFAWSSRIPTTAHLGRRIDQLQRESRSLAL